MAAAVLTSPGASPPQACFTYDASYPRPTLPSPEWTLVRVHALGLNRAELRSRANLPPFLKEFNIFQAEYHADPPKILGEEFVGIVEDAGAESGFQRGEPVTGMIYGGGKAHDGSYAEFTLCHRRRLYRLPVGIETRLDWNVIGGVPMSMKTAYGSVVLAGGLDRRPKGSTVMVHGGSSSVGVWAIMLAKDRGAKVIATTRNKHKIAQLKKVGADHVFLEGELEAEVPKQFPKGIDIILELVGPDQTLRSLGFAARFGTVVLAGVLNLGWEAEGLSPFMIPPTRNLSFYTMTNDGIGSEDDGLEDMEGLLAHVLEKVEKGIYPAECFLDKTFKLEEMGDAHAYMEDNKACGGVVVIVT